MDLRKTMNVRKDLYAIGEIPPLGYLPDRMHAFAIRRERHGEPMIALQHEIVPTPTPNAGEVVVMIMAAGVGMSTVWACLGIPATQFVAGRRPYHVPGSDCTGVIWAIGASVTGWQIGAEVVVHPVVRGATDDNVAETLVQVWGYETPDGALAQFARVRAEQLMPRPSHLTWVESACYLSTLATAYRMLFGHPPHVVGPGQAALVWGAAQGLGAMAVQLVRAVGATVVGVVNGSEQVGFATKLGAHGVIDWNRFDCFMPLPDVEDRAAYSYWQRQTDTFIAAACVSLGRRGKFDIVFEHLGQVTFPLSCRLVRRDGMIIFCGGTTGYTFTFDARPAWMEEIRLQGSHLASTADAVAANRLVAAGQVVPYSPVVYDWQEIPQAHTQMLHGWSGTMVVLVQDQYGKNETGRSDRRPASGGSHEHEHQIFDCAGVDA